MSEFITFEQIKDQFIASVILAACQNGVNDLDRVAPMADDLWGIYGPAILASLKHWIIEQDKL